MTSLVVASDHPSPVQVLAASGLFRVKYKAITERLGLSAEIPAEVWQKAWNVNCKAVGDGRLALRYLAPYVFRVAISNSRIVRVEPGPDGTTIRSSSAKDCDAHLAGSVGWPEGDGK